MADAGAVEGDVDWALAEIDWDCDLGSAGVYGDGGGWACALAVGGEDGGCVLLDVRLGGLGTDLDGGLTERGIWGDHKVDLGAAGVKDCCVSGYAVLICDCDLVAV